MTSAGERIKAKTPGPFSRINMAAVIHDWNHYPNKQLDCAREARLKLFHFIREARRTERTVFALQRFFEGLGNLKTKSDIAQAFGDYIYVYACHKKIDSRFRIPFFHRLLDITLGLPTLGQHPRKLKP